MDRLKETLDALQIAPTDAFAYCYTANNKQAEAKRVVAYLQAIHLAELLNYI